ncbi:phospholipase-like protein [Tanacetum coccineum]
MLRKQHKVDSSHYDMPLIYYTEGHSLHFGRPEFALITGLPFGDVNFGLYTSGELKFRNRVFPHKLGSSVTNLDLIGVIEDEETFQKLCDEDSIRLCLILCLEVIFMGRLLTCPVDDTLFRLVESLEDWNCFPWGEHIWTHLYDQIQNVIEKHSDEHYFGMKKDPKYVPMYTLSGFVFAFQVWIFESFERCNCWWSKDPNVIPRAVGWSKKSIFNRSDCGYLFAKQSTTTSEIRPSKAEYESSWWIRSQLFFRQHVPKAPVAQHHSMYETYLAKLEKSRKRVHSSFRTSSGVLTTVLARERKNEYELLQFKDEFSRLGREFMNSLNILFEELSQPLYTYENLSNDYLVEEELRLCLEAKERMRLEHEKNILEELSFMVKEAKRIKLEEEKLLQISHMPGKSKATVSWVKLNKHRLNVNDPSLAKLLRKVKPWVEDLSRSFHSLDTVWLTPDIQRFISREGNIKCKFPWSDDYTIGQNFWLTLHIDLWVDYMWHGRPDNANWAMVFFPINETAQHWCLAHFDIVSGLVTFYDSGDTYDYESRDFYVRVRECLKERLPGILGATKVYEKKGIDHTDYSIRFKLADHVPKHGGILVAMAYSASSGSSKKVVPKYVKFMVLEKISECKRTINFIVGEVQNATSHLEHLNGMIEMLEGMHFTLEIYDSVWCLREMVKSENKKLNDLNKQLLDAEEDIRDFVDENMTDDMPVLDEVVFKIHKNGYFELDPLRYVNGSFSSVSAFTCDRDIFPSCLNWILSSIPENIWALFYCLPNTPLEKGLKLIHTDNDVLSFFAEAERRGKIHLYVTHKQQALGKFYLKNMVWLEEDASLRCSSSSPFSTRIKRKSHKTTKDCGRKNSRGKEKMVDDEPLGRKLLKTSRTGKEKMDELDEFPDLTPTKEREVDDDVVGRNSIRTRRKGKEIMAEFSCTPANEKKVVVNNYRRALINGKYRMVEVADVGLVEDELNLLNKKDLGKKPVGSATDVQEFPVKAEYFF